jgi:ribosomal protein S18 acetylase RimI-like enzyme
MVTVPEHRRLGLGRAVLDGLLRAAIEGGGGLVWCNARTTVRGFYEASGFVTDGDVFELPDLGPHVRMSLEL